MSDSPGGFETRSGLSGEFLVERFCKSESLSSAVTLDFSWSLSKVRDETVVFSPSDDSADVSPIVQGGTNVLATDPVDTPRLNSSDVFTDNSLWLLGRRFIGVTPDVFFNSPLFGSNIVSLSKTMVTGPL